jgi:hypothetical protein
MYVFILTRRPRFTCYIATAFASVLELSDHTTQNKIVNIYKLEVTLLQMSSSENDFM